jgi:hypothetical protein
MQTTENFVAGLIWALLKRKNVGRNSTRGFARAQTFRGGKVGKKITPIGKKCPAGFTENAD